MLVLSRRPNDRVVFPELGITIQVVRVDGKTVRLGIDAPRHVSILRHEIAEQETRKPREQSVNLSHELRNRLNSTTLGLHLLQKQLERGRSEEVDATLSAIMQELSSMEQFIARSRETDENFVNGQRCKALVVEDNQNESALLAGYLRSCNFDVATAYDGQDALLYLAKNHKPDVVLLDMNLPHMDGKTMVSQIRNNPEHAGLKVFAVSGFSPRDVGLSTGPNGVDRWFTKPIQPDVLVRVIRDDLAGLQNSA